MQLTEDLGDAEPSSSEHLGAEQIGRNKLAVDATRHGIVLGQAIKETTMSEALRSMTRGNVMGFWWQVGV